MARKLIDETSGRMIARDLKIAIAVIVVAALACVCGVNIADWLGWP